MLLTDPALIMEELKLENHQDLYARVPCASTNSNSLFLSCDAMYELLIQLMIDTLQHSLTRSNSRIKPDQLAEIKTRSAGAL